MQLQPRRFGLLPVDIFNKFRLSVGDRFGRVKNRMQAEGGFESRRIFVGCLASAIEFGFQ
jgi:hypothetical protein